MSSSPDLPEAQAIADRFFQAACDPEGGSALYALYAPEAAVELDHGWRRRSQLDPQRFAADHRARALAGAGALPVFLAPVVLDQIAGEEPHTQTVWLSVKEEKLDADLTGVLGLSCGAEGWRVAWATLGQENAKWTFREGLLRALADYPWMKPRAPAHARTSLDAAFLRRYWRPSVPLVSQPGARFSCRMSAVCCKQDYAVVLPAAAQEVIDALPWERLEPRLQGTRLTALAEGQLQLKANAEACRFLGSRNQCLVHEALGFQPFAPCAVFPFAFAETPEGVAVSASLTCGSVCDEAGLPLAERDDDLRLRLALSTPRAPRGFRLSPGRPIDWAQFRDIEQALIGLLEQDRLPVYRRLYLGNRLLRAVANAGPFAFEQWTNQPMATLDLNLRLELAQFLSRMLAVDRIAFRALPRAFPRELAHRRLVFPARLATLLKSSLFSKVYSYEHDLTTAHNFSILVYLLALALQTLIEEPFPEALWRELAFFSGHGLLNSLVGKDCPENLRQLLGSTDFGEWALGYPTA